MNEWASEMHEHVSIEYNLSYVLTNEGMDMWACDHK